MERGTPVIDFLSRFRTPASPDDQRRRDLRRSQRIHARRWRRQRIRAYFHANATSLAALAVLLAGWAALTYATAEFFAGVRFATPWLSVGEGGSRRIVWSASAGVFCLWLTGRGVLVMVWAFGAARLHQMSEEEKRRVAAPPQE